MARASYGSDALMNASSTWNGFYRLMQRALPQYTSTLEMPLDYGDEIEADAA
jgi:hypothetical protein